MATKTTFNIDSKSITSVFEKAFKTIQDSKLKVGTPSGKVYIHISLILAIIIAVIFPVALILLLVSTLFSSINIAIEKEMPETSMKTQMIELNK
ncbi:hypothetical protein LZQ00_17190 [Sphingobacterium sp. SRCM116780]|uniref:hypothetical protein n=1 Tax=Sphingobacterium sp. SRCM116780 TaxID=2907623 RepID=UPI001F36DCAF|nr:hypothetical protein [Sphingobacterium sp. SRCM116780]UIR55985.1 hypothetical protein LZQ00_17190 [Sphingobacterium sp. SRCM116780]